MLFQSISQLSDAEIDVIYAIAERALAIYEDDGESKSILNAFVDIARFHAFYCPLRLRELRDAGIEAFVEDILGIKRHLERKKRGRRVDFIPRYAAATEAAA